MPGGGLSVKKLTAKQARFVSEYLIDLNASQAALRAGYKNGEKGRQLVPKSNVAEAIREAMAEREKRTQITQDRVVNEIAKIAFGDMRDVMEWGPRGVRLRPSSEIPADAAAFVSEVSETTTETGGSLKLKTNDKLKALELLGRHLGAFQDKVDVTGGLKIEISYGNEDSDSSG